MNYEILDSHQQGLLFESMYANAETERELIVFKSVQPALYKDGNQWCCLYGSNLQEGIAGFGDTPHQAVKEFTFNWFNEKP